MEVVFGNNIEKRGEKWEAHPPYFIRKVNPQKYDDESEIYKKELETEKAVPVKSAILHVEHYFIHAV